MKRWNPFRRRKTKVAEIVSSTELPHFERRRSVDIVPTSNVESTHSRESDAIISQKDNFSGDVISAILKREIIRRKIANLLLQGLPESGKTSLLDRLLNKALRESYPSTGMCESSVLVEVKSGVIVKVDPSSTHTSAYACDGMWKETDFNMSMVSQLNNCNRFTSRKTVEEPLVKVSSKRIDKPVSTSQNPWEAPQQHCKAGPSEIDTPISDFEYHIKEVLNKHNINNIEDLQAKNSLYIRDTGGQVEFQESLSLLIFGPSIFIFVMRTDIDIHAKNIIQYRSSTGEFINKYQSSISTKDALIQFLTSVSAIQTTEEGVFQVDGTSICHKPIVFIVGTHIDKLGSNAFSVLANINKVLHTIICKWNFSPLIRYADGYSNKVMYEVDNTCSEDQHFQHLRSDISDYISGKSEFYVEYPVSYLLFCLELENIKETVLSMDQCKQLAEKFYIKEEAMETLLHFLHFRVGIIQHYNVKGISDVIIKEPQVLFSKVTNLILNTFLYKTPLSIDDQRGFCQKGILEFSAFEDVLSDKDRITAEQFLLFLLHLRIAVPFTDKKGILKYFIPSALNHVPKSPSDMLNTDIAPLAITFQLGHCPKGLFGMLISFLMSPEGHQQITFDLLEDRIYQDQVFLRVNSSEDADLVCLKSNLSHLEVYLILQSYSAAKSSGMDLAPRSVTSSEVCNSVRRTLKNCLQLSLKKLHYDCNKVGASFSLTCPYEKCSQLHEVKIGQQSNYIHCNAYNCKLLLPQSGCIWFSEASPSRPLDATTTPSQACASHGEASVQLHSTNPGTFSVIPQSSESKREDTHFRNPKVSFKNLILLKWTDDYGQEQSLSLRNEISSSWHDAGVLFGLDLSRLDNIKTFHLNDVRLCCSDVLQDWLKIGSSEYPTSWEGLLTLLKDLKLNSLRENLTGALKMINK